MKPKTPYMRALRDRILNSAMDAFVARGIKAVKMDDIAQSLCVSKRTLYEIYENKEVLLYEGVKKFREQREEEMKKLIAESPNVIEVIMLVYRQKVEDFRKSCPEFYADLSKYPLVTEYLHQDHLRSHELFISFLERGVGEGYFRNDVELELVSMMFTSITDYIMNHQLYKQYTIEQLFHNLVFVSLRGFCTSEGIKLLDSYFKLNNAH